MTLTINGAQQAISTATQQPQDAAPPPRLLPVLSRWQHPAPRPPRGLEFLASQDVSSSCTLLPATRSARAMSAPAGSQLPLRAPRSDARQNLLDSIQVATSASSPPHVSLQEVAVCFGGKLMRGNRTQKHATATNCAAVHLYGGGGQDRDGSLVSDTHKQ
ncbi:hypothetical protein TSOC_003253 [Tetrabaena socialis]|uniref:L-asparaginase N-terminal domain-containing protein n=1 Tax=Tetrabaena socialis TaxID=47790 RepID=A0A2J8AC10_9CHLO|nr:hypothetical protein TSOC_003253 [Tetrabaena socialis]|eukprot:PNH10064.1 hypothetical protein TSOC_003253 [Tetrabaena socialis]